MTAREKKNHMKKALDSNFFAELCSSSSWLAGRQGDSCGTFPALKPRGMWQLSWDPETPQHCRDLDEVSASVRLLGLLAFLLIFLPVHTPLTQQSQQ